jgi:hypothetical protein
LQLKIARCGCYMSKQSRRTNVRDKDEEVSHSKTIERDNQ